MKFNEAMNNVKNLEAKKQQLIQKKTNLEREIGQIDQQITQALEKQGGEEDKNTFGKKTLRDQEQNQDQKGGRVNPTPNNTAQNSISNTVQRA